MRIGGPTAFAMSLEGDAALTRKPIAIAQKVVSSIVATNIKYRSAAGFRPTLQ